MRLGPFLRRWLLPALLAIVALVAWQAANRADFDTVTPVPEEYEATLTTPMLSARRVPRTLRAPISDALIAPEVDRIASESPSEQVCVAARNGDRPLGQTADVPGGLVPASNQKLLTTYAALGILGDDFVFTTSAVALGTPQDGVLDGDLFLIGDGDPFLFTDDWLPQYEEIQGRFHTRLEDLADQVVGQGVTEITGSVLGDESLFDDVRYGPWDQRLIDQKQSGPLSALTVNEGFTQWQETFRSSFRPRSETDNPPVHSASVFVRLLAERGVTVTGGFDAGVAPTNTVALGAVESPPLTDIATHINSYSSNIGAELLLKRLGLTVSGQGTTEAGAAAVTAYLVEQGVPLTDVQIFDGSGLSEDNRLTCAALITVLVGQGPDTSFGQSLSIAGQRGSLADRFGETPADGLVLAKTGTLREVRALSGYVEAGTEPEDGYVSFAYVVNDSVIDVERVLALQDQLVSTLTTYPSGPTIEELSPLSPVPG